ncbi:MULTISPECIES: glycosyltransferase [unclassified Endozoicomonas]|uniref:glycosyltransferase n=1 Tax=unclassified Endozoicomonas TaxID=2644528 RepID=UPI003BB49022
MTSKTKERWVLQLCHGYDMPFHDIARQYTRLLNKLNYKVLTVFLTGKKDSKIARYTDSDKVIFLENSSEDLRGAKRKQIAQVKEIYNETTPEFVVAQRYKAIYIACHLPETPVIGVCHAFGVFNRWRRRAFAYLNRKRLFLLGVSNAVCNNIKQALPFFPSGQIRYQYNHIDIKAIQDKQLSREESRKLLGLPADGYIFGNVGRLHPDKDQASLIKAFARAVKSMPDASLVIIGKGKLESDLKKLAKKENIQKKVVFTGVVPDAYKYFKAFNSFILTSDHEPFGMVVLEAMAAGLPVASSNCGGPGEILKSNLFTTGDTDRIANILLELYQSKDNGIYQLELQRFSLEITAEDFIDSLNYWKID